MYKYELKIEKQDGKIEESVLTMKEEPTINLMNKFIEYKNEKNKLVRRMFSQFDDISLTEL